MTARDPSPGDPPAPPAAGEGGGISCAPLAPPIAFTEELLERVAAFECGSEPWEREVADYIRAPRGTGGALDDMANNGTQVWLYETTAGELMERRVERAMEMHHHRGLWPH
jgi:hypothetical protein